MYKYIWSIRRLNIKTDVQVEIENTVFVPLTMSRIHKTISNNNSKLCIHIEHYLIITIVPTIHEIYWWIDEHIARHYHITMCSILYEPRIHKCDSSSRAFRSSNQRSRYLDLEHINLFVSTEHEVNDFRLMVKTNLNLFRVMRFA